VARINAVPVPDTVETTLQLTQAPLANTNRYDSLRGDVGLTTPLCQTSCRPIMIAEDPHRSAIYEQKFTFN